MFVFNLKPFVRNDFLKLSRNFSNAYTSFVSECVALPITSQRFSHSLALSNKSRRPFLFSYANQSISNRSYAIEKPEKRKPSPITWKTFMYTALVGCSFVAYLLYLKNLKRKEKEKVNRAIIGKAKIGGKFELVDSNNKPVTSDDFLGQWLLIYFGFTHCPDICPDEIEKMAKVVDILDSKNIDQNVKPIFITVDPERDSPSAVGKYCKEFSEKIIGLTGTADQISKVCKAFRVYFSAGPKDTDNDYIVDHTIIIYFLSPDGQFIDYFPQIRTAEQIADEILLYMTKHNFLKSKGIISTLREKINI